MYSTLRFVCRFVRGLALSGVVLLCPIKPVEAKSTDEVCAMMRQILQEQALLQIKLGAELYLLVESAKGGPLSEQADSALGMQNESLQKLNQSIDEFAASCLQ